MPNLTQALGFGPAPWPVYVYCNRQHGGNWYTIQDGDPVVINHEALTGIPLGITFPKVERRGKETIKINVEVQADRRYVLESGYDSQFAKSLLCALAAFPPGALAGIPVTFVPQPGSDPSVLFCRVFVDGQPIRGVEMPEDNDGLRTVARAAKAAIGGAG